MSTANSNLDNDPFPVFTPRSSLQQQQQIGRSPHQQNMSTPSNLNLLASPYTSQRFSSNNQQQQQQQMMGLMRSPSASISSNSLNLRHQLQQQQIHNDSASSHRQLIASMVQNLSFNQTASTALQSTQSPHINKLTTPSSTPPPQGMPGVPNQLASTSATQLSAPGSMGPPSAPVSNPNAHRKLFPVMDNNHHLSGGANDMVLLNGNQLDYSQQGHHMSHHHQHVQYQQQQEAALEPSRQAPSDLANIAHLKRSDSYFMSDELRSEIIRKNLILLSMPTQDVAIQLPSQVKDYHNLVPLDSQQINIDHKSRTFSYQTISYKATHVKTNCVYYLKRILGFRYVNQRCIDIVETWKKIQHANICSLRDVFGTKEFNGDHSIVFVYDFYPGLETLQYRLYNNPNINLKGWANPYNLDGAARPFSASKNVNLNASRSLGLLSEQSVWDYIIQLTSIIRTVHSANLACRIISPARIIVDHKSRLRLSGVGIFDVVDCENSLNNVAQFQQEDLIEFGRLALALACNSLIAIQKEHINTSLDIISRNYSSDLRNLIVHFMTPQSNINGRVKNINDSMPIIGARFYTSLNNAYTRGDVIENDLANEIENGRLFRLITKINIVLERQDINGDQWNETGDRYMLKLFRDYVFHQVTPNGNPWIDLSHIVQCLNKFDAGSSDKICLVSPDGQNIMIVSYTQLKKCFEKAFNEITLNMNT